MSIHFKDACLSFKINFLFWLSDKILANVHRGYDHFDSVIYIPVFMDYLNEAHVYIINLEKQGFLPVAYLNFQFFPPFLLFKVLTVLQQ